MRTPDSKTRKVMAIAIYTFLIVWLIYSQNRVPATPPAVVKQAVVIP